MSPRPAPPLTDSPWFWLLAFSIMALAALAAMNGKYGRRQSNIERQYQARERSSFAADELSNQGIASVPRPYATPDTTLIPLWPLALLVGGMAAIAFGMLWRQRRLQYSPDKRSSA